MKKNDTNEQLAARAFTSQSVIFDDIYGADTIIQYKRSRVRQHVEKSLPPQASILELNSGTGEDAVYFASKGHRVHATDISPGMQEKLKTKVKFCKVEDKVTNELCSFTDLATLTQRGPYDLIFSNFAGLNCTGDLPLVLEQLPQLLKPGGLITLVVLPRFCAWEFLLILKGKFRTATRRLFSRNGASAHVEGTRFKCWYYNPSFITKRLEKDFEIVSVEGLCVFVPPSYMLHFAEKHPRLYHILTNLENRFKQTWPFNRIGDYYILTARRKQT